MQSFIPAHQFVPTNPPQFLREMADYPGFREITNLHETMFIGMAHYKIDAFAAAIGYYHWLGPKGTPMIAMPQDIFYFDNLLRIVEMFEGVGWQGVRINILGILYEIFKHSGEIGSKILHVDQDFVMWLRYACKPFVFTNVPDGDYSGHLFAALMEIYYGMIAENCRANTRLGARIKLCGLVKMLFGGMTVEQAAGCMNDVDAEIIDADCIRWGIYDPSVDKLHVGLGQTLQDRFLTDTRAEARQLGYVY